MDVIRRFVPKPRTLETLDQSDYSQESDVLTQVTSLPSQTTVMTTLSQGAFCKILASFRAHQGLITKKRPRTMSDRSLPQWIIPYLAKTPELVNIIKAYEINTWSRSGEIAHGSYRSLSGAGWADSDVGFSQVCFPIGVRG